MSLTDLKLDKKELVLGKKPQTTNDLAQINKQPSLRTLPRLIGLGEVERVIQRQLKEYSGQLKVQQDVFALKLQQFEQKIAKSRRVPSERRTGRQNAINQRVRPYSMQTDRCAEGMQTVINIQSLKVSFIRAAASLICREIIVLRLQTGLAITLTRAVEEAEQSTESSVEALFARGAKQFQVRDGSCFFVGAERLLYRMEAAEGWFCWRRLNLGMRVRQLRQSHNYLFVEGEAREEFVLIQTTTMQLYWLKYPARTARSCLVCHSHVYLVTSLGRLLKSAKPLGQTLLINFEQILELDLLLRGAASVEGGNVLVVLLTSMEYGVLEGTQLVRRGRFTKPVDKLIGVEGRAVAEFTDGGSAFSLFDQQGLGWVMYSEEQ